MSMKLRGVQQGRRERVALSPRTGTFLRCTYLTRYTRKLPTSLLPEEPFLCGGQDSTN
jgi:hypothetical protein